MHHVPHVFPGLPEKRLVHADSLPDSEIGEIQYILSVHVVGRQRARARQVLLIFGDSGCVAIGKVQGGLPRCIPPTARAGRTCARQRIKGPSRCQHAPHAASDSGMPDALEPPGHA